MKAILFLLFVTFALSATNYRHIEIYPNDGSASSKIWVTEEFLHNQLIYFTNVTFMDITGLRPVEQPKNLNFPENPNHVELVKSINSEIKTESLKAYLEGLTSNPHRNSRRAGSEKSIEWTVSEIEKIIKSLPEERQKLFKVDLVEIRGYVAKSIIVSFKGNSTENVIFGAHVDGKFKFLFTLDVGHPQAGADDNASGSVTVLEALRVIAKSKFVPIRTLLFMWYTAEEQGLVGSRQIAQEFKRTGKKVHAVLNHDMVGYNRPGQPLQAYLIIPQTNSALNTFLKKLIKEYSGIPVLDYRQTYGSDHASWNSAGYPAAGWKEFYWSPQYHQASDKTVHVNVNLLQEFTKVGVSFLVELSL